MFLTVFPPFYSNRVNRSRRSLLRRSFFKSVGSHSLFSSFALSLTKTKRFAGKTKEQIPNPAKLRGSEIVLDYADMVSA